MTGVAARWRMLALLFMARTAMAFQFQVVGALSPLFAETFRVGLADIGLLIGLYLAPGIAFALPGGELGARFGDRTMVLVGLALMAAGGAVGAVGAGFEAQVAGRLIAGVGGVMLNVLMTKMVADWFAGREIATAMSIFVNSWPLGIALALAALPAVAEAGGVAAALAMAAAFAALCMPLVAIFYRPAPQAAGFRLLAATTAKSASAMARDSRPRFAGPSGLSAERPSGSLLDGVQHVARAVLRGGGLGRCA